MEEISWCILIFCLSLWPGYLRNPKKTHYEDSVNTGSPEYTAWVVTTELSRQVAVGFILM